MTVVVPAAIVSAMSGERILSRKRSLLIFFIPARFRLKVIPPLPVILVNLVNGLEAVGENEQTASEKTEDEEKDIKRGVQTQLPSVFRLNFFPVSEKL